MILLLLKSEADCLADQRWQEWRIEFGRTPPEQLPRERFSPLADSSRPVGMRAISFAFAGLKKAPERSRLLDMPVFLQGAELIALQVCGCRNPRRSAVGLLMSQTSAEDLIARQQVSRVLKW